MTHNKLSSTADQAPPPSLHNLEALSKIKVRDNITLRPLEITHAERILEILDSDNSIRDKVAVASSLWTADDVEQQIDSYKHNNNLIRYTILEDNNPIGLISFWRDIGDPFGGPDRPDDYGFGYFLDPMQRGKGILSDALKELMATSGSVLRINQFIAYCKDSNEQSIAVLTKLGFCPAEIDGPTVGNGWRERKYVKSPDS